MTIGCYLSAANLQHRGVLRAMALARYCVVRLDEVIAGGIRGVLYDGLFGEAEHIPPSQLKTYARSI